MVKSGSLPPARNAAGAKIWLLSELQDSLDGLEISQPKELGGGGDSTNRVFGIEGEP